MKYIELTQGQRTVVDNDMYEYLNQWKWIATKSRTNNKYYAKRNEYKNGRTKVIHMARVIAGTPRHLEPDHINRNTLDNRRENIRNVTHKKNMTNQDVHVNNKLHEKNIHLYERMKGYVYYRVMIKRNKKVVYVKNFKTLEEAIKNRDIFLQKWI